MRYGLPYKGSKNALAERLVSLLPRAETLIDIFAGGFSITHRALLTRKYRRVIANDLDPMPITLFRDAVNGKYRNETEWISSEKFFERKDTDPYVALCWSFSNNGRGYLYSREIEPWKRALHYDRVFGDFTRFRAMGIKTDGSAKDIMANHEQYKRQYIRWYVREKLGTDLSADAFRFMLENEIKERSRELREYLRAALAESGRTQKEVNDYLGNQMAGHYFGVSQWEFPTLENYEKMREILPTLKPYLEIGGLNILAERLQRLQSLESLERLESLQSLESLERLESLQSLERLERLESLEITNLSYDQVATPADSVIYCDPPYKGTDGYNVGDFNHEAFYDWCCKQTVPVFISEYQMPADRFKCVAEFKHINRMSGKGNSTITERLFAPINQQNYIPQQLKLF